MPRRSWSARCRRPGTATCSTSGCLHRDRRDARHRLGAGRVGDAGRAVARRGGPTLADRRAYRSLLAPGWGQLYNRQPVKAGLFAAAELALLGGALAFQLEGAKAERDYQAKATPAALGPDLAAAAAALRADAHDAYACRNRLLWGAAAVWVLGAVDAYAFGVDGDKIASGLTVLPTGEGLGLALAGRY